MIAFDDLQYLAGVYVVIFLFYYGFFINRNRSLIKYEDAGYLEYRKATLKERDNLSDPEIARLLEGKIREKNLYQVYNMVFFVFFTLSFLGMAWYLTSLR